MKSLMTIAILLTLTFAGSTQAQPDDQQKQQPDPATSGWKQFSAEDQLAIAAQKICPVSGEELGSHGSPIKIKAGQQVAFLCCSACQKKSIDGKHWKTIQSRIAQAQGDCPIMGKPVDATMQSTIVGGRKIFVCCPPCIEKIQAEPKKAIAKVTAAYKTFVTAEQQIASDRLHALAQGICPVSGQKLGSMGQPVKIKVGASEHAFLCCDACVGKSLQTEHWETAKANLAKAQAICPVMGKPVDETMKSTVVKGRRIFVCCPPCIEKIEADPDKYVKFLNQQIANQKAEQK